MRVLRDVVIHRTDDNELHAVSHAPAIIGEEMTLDVMGAGATVGFKVKVLESRPVMIDGAVRHRVRLAVLNADGQVQAATPERQESDRQAPIIPFGAAPAEAI
jgi:hypothetical protein